MTDFRKDLRSGLDRLWRLGDPAILAENAVFDCAWPLNKIVGKTEILMNFVHPLRSALTGCHRRDTLFLGGENIRETGGHWCASITHYVGNFGAPFLGIAPHNSLVFFRAGEFYRVEGGKITEAKIIFDLPDLLRQTGHAPFPVLGTEITFPAPATQDGLCPPSDRAAQTLDLVQNMLADLRVFDPETMSSSGQTGSTGYWHDDMMWYGPSGIGSNFRWDGFVKDHRTPFLIAFPDRVGGDHYCRFGDGHYAAVSGWPSMTMTWQGDYLGLKADGRPLTLRVMDFYRCAGDKIMENWVCLDYGDLVQQMGKPLPQVVTP